MFYMFICLYASNTLTDTWTHTIRIRMGPEGCFRAWRRLIGSLDGHGCSGKCFSRRFHRARGPRSDVSRQTRHRHFFFWFDNFFFLFKLEPLCDSPFRNGPWSQLAASVGPRGHGDLAPFNELFHLHASHTRRAQASPHGRGSCRRMPCSTTKNPDKSAHT